MKEFDLYMLTISQGCYLGSMYLTEKTLPWATACEKPGKEYFSFSFKSANFSLVGESKKVFGRYKYPLLLQKNMPIDDCWYK
jgi:hypothetical protein